MEVPMKLLTLISLLAFSGLSMATTVEISEGTSKKIINKLKDQPNDWTFSEGGQATVEGKIKCEFNAFDDSVHSCVIETSKN